MFFAPLLCKMEGLTHQALLVLIPLEENKIQLPHFKALSSSFNIQMTIGMTTILSITHCLEE